MLNIGVSTNNECGEDDLEILNNIAKAGFKNIMLSFKSKDMEESIKIANNLGLEIPYFHISTKYADNLWSKGESVDRYIDSTIKQIEICGQYNIPIAVMHLTSGNPTERALPPNKNGLENFKKVLDAAKKNNVKIAIENMDRDSIKHFFYILDNINDENLGFCYDAGHHHLYNHKINLLKKYGSRLLAIHLHDNLMDWEPGHDYTRDLHRLPFDGNIDYPKVCANLKKINYNGIIMLEIHKRSCGQPRIYEDVDNLEFLKEAYNRGVKLAKLVEEGR